MQIRINVSDVQKKDVQKVAGMAGIRKVLFNNPVTVVFWTDGTKTTVKCQPGDTYDKEEGLITAIAKKAMGNGSKWYDTIKKVLKDEETQLKKKAELAAAKLQKKKETDVFGETEMSASEEPVVTVNPSVSEEPVVVQEEIVEEFFDMD